MAKTIMLYGATGYSGGLIAGEANRLQRANAIGFRMVLAARNRLALSAMAKAHGMEARAFALNDRDRVVRELEGIDVVLNAAGPFAATAPRLATAALEKRCHYVDLNGEIDVYQSLDDLAPHAYDRNVCMVCSAGFTAAASGLLLEEALRAVKTRYPSVAKLGAIRFSMSSPRAFSRGSVNTMWRSLREQVTVVRDIGGGSHKAVLWHSPVAKLERSADFTPPGRKAATVEHETSPLKNPHRRIVMAANLVDTLTARLTASRNGMPVRDIESYVEVGDATRLGYPLANLGTPALTSPIVRKLAALAIDTLPEGPSRQERERERQMLLLTIEDPMQRPLIDWCLSTPNAYDFSARVALEIAQKAVVGSPQRGWKTPGEILRDANATLKKEQADGPLRGCQFVDRLPPA